MEGAEGEATFFGSTMQSLTLRYVLLQSNYEPANLESLEVVVIVTPLTLLPGEMFPVPGETRQYNDITYGKPGGSRNP